MPDKHEKDEFTPYFQQLRNELFSTVLDEFLPEHERIDEAISEQMVELLSLRLDVEEIKERVQQLGTYHAASYWQFPLGERRLNVYLDQSLPEGNKTNDHFQYLRVLVNRMTRVDDGSEIADIEDYYVDLDNGGLTSYRGQARKSTSGWTLPVGTPPLALNFAMEVHFLDSESYNPHHPRTPDEDTLLEDLQYQRQDALLVLSALKHLNPHMQADITIPYKKT